MSKNKGIVVPPSGPTVTIKAEVYEALCSCYSELRSIYKQFGGDYSLSAGITDVDAASPDFNPTIELDSFNPRQYIGFIKKTVPQNTTTTGHQHNINKAVLDAIKMGLFAEDDYENADLEAAKRGLFKTSHTNLDLFYNELANRFKIKFTEEFKAAALKEEFSYDQLCRILRAWMQSMPKYEPQVESPTFYADLYKQKNKDTGNLNVLNEREIKDRIVDAYVLLDEEYNVEPCINNDTLKGFIKTDAEFEDFMENVEVAFDIGIPIQLIDKLKALRDTLKFIDILNIILAIKNINVIKPTTKTKPKRGKPSPADHPDFD